uniref:Uncharacterized protein n=1 Tax=Glossina palpalis gambiensis TaxID=67801 RepID=A0A1B0BQJ2_9MUSC
MVYKLYGKNQNQIQQTARRQQTFKAGVQLLFLFITQKSRLILQSCLVKQQQQQQNQSVGLSSYKGKPVSSGKQFHINYLKLLDDSVLVALTGPDFIDEKSVSILSMMRNETHGTSYFSYIYPNKCRNIGLCLSTFICGILKSAETDLKNFKLSYRKNCHVMSFANILTKVEILNTFLGYREQTCIRTSLTF